VSNSAKPYFLANLGAIRLTWPDAPEEPALRSAQLGAILALSGHLQTSEEAAQAVVPTGVGKTAVLCALPYLVPSTRLLVIVPTRLLRDQVAEEFRTLATLRRVGAVSDELTTPSVRRVDRRITSMEAWNELREYDVAVGTPAVLSAVYEEIPSPPQDLFDLLIFDEAHHLPASTWEGIYAQPRDRRRTALVTATPFRRDRKRLPGSLVYHYSLRQAIADEVYAPVEFIPVEALTDLDGAIAETAVARLRSEVHQREGSLLLVRTGTIDHAEQLVGVYGNLGVALGIITVRQSGRTVRRTIERLRAGELEGVASVGALVEGFDLPKLKIAAYHRPHRSLPPTLQFVGRIARVTGGDAPAELVAARQEVTYETAELYREDVAWAQLLPELVDAAVQREQDTRRYLADSSVSGPEDLSASALTPRRLVQVFDTGACGDIDLGAELATLRLGRVILRVVDPDGALLAVVTERVVRPQWFAGEALDHVEHHLVVAVHDHERQLLFVSAPSVAAANRLRDDISAKGAVRISPQLVARYLWDATVASYSSVGMSSTRAAARIASYRMLAGSAVEGAVSLADTRGYGLGHVIGRRSDGGKLTGMGVSMKKSKIWESANCESLLDFREWCETLAVAIRTDAATAESVPHLQLRLPQQLHAFPSHPIAAFLDTRLVRGDTFAILDGERVDLGSLQLVASSLADDELRLVLGFDDGAIWSAVATTDTSLALETDELIVITSNGERETLVDLLTDYPPTIYFADGSAVTAVTIFQPVSDLPQLPEEAFAIWDWDTTDIRIEDSDPPEAPMNVQDRTVAYARSLPDTIVAPPCLRSARLGR
jgi:superfamily II DNA or RNA helicase